MAIRITRTATVTRIIRTAITRTTITTDTTHITDRATPTAATRSLSEFNRGWLEPVTITDQLTASWVRERATPHVDLDRPEVGRRADLEVGGVVRHIDDRVEKPVRQDRPDNARAQKKSASSASSAAMTAAEGTSTIIPTGT